MDSMSHRGTSGIAFEVLWHERATPIFGKPLSAPTEPPSQSMTPENTHTGAPGRPTIMPFIEREFEARAARGELMPTLTEELKALRDWAVENYTIAPTPKTI